MIIPRYFLLYNFLILFFLMFCLTFCATNPQESSGKGAQSNNDTLWWQKAAKKMVKNHIRSRGISDRRLLSAMENTPRHEFVPKNLVSYAYDDNPLPIAEQQTISQPYIVALMTELLQLKGHERILEIGTGSGYQAAVLSPLVDSCYSIELLKPLADTAAAVLHKLGYKNVVVRQGDGYKGWPGHAPFDGIIITAAPEEIPEDLIDQLRIGGRMVVPVGKFDQELWVVTKTKNGALKEKIIPVRFVPLVKP